MPTEEPTLGFCQHEGCSNTLENRFNYTVYTNSYDRSEHRQQWCASCVNNSDTFTCIHCGNRFTCGDNLNEIDCEACGHSWCTYCYDNFHESHTSNCDRCELELSPDDLYWIEDMGESLCENCREAYCQYCEAYQEFYSRDNHEFTSLVEGNYVLAEYYRNNANEFNTCTTCGKIIWKEIENSFFSADSHFFCNACVETMFPPSRLDEMQREREARIRTRYSTPSRTKTKKSIGIDYALKLVAQAAQRNLENASPPQISPVHTKIYTGLEIEGFGGLFARVNFVDTPGKARYFMGPNRMLSKELPKYTKVVNDGSIQGHNGKEFLPPVVKKRSDWKKVEKLVNTLKEFNWKTNESCGLHMHFSHGKMTPDNPELIRRVFRLFYHLEPMIFACLPESRRNNEYCYPISKFFTKKEVYQDTKLDYWYYQNFWKKRVQRPRNFGNQRYPVMDERNRVVNEVPLAKPNSTKES